MINALLTIFLGSLTTFFLAINSEIFVTNYYTGLLTFILSLAVILLLRLCLEPLSIIPFLIFLFLLPYCYFYAHLPGWQPIGCLSIITAGAFIFNSILKKDFKQAPLAPFWLPALLIIYAAYFSFLAVERHLNFQNASSFDVAIYSQIQWNNIHGRLFHTSFSGSNFVTHNSPFLILLSPFYAIYPHPPGLLVLKTIFVTVGAIPFYLIVKEMVDERCALPLVISYLFYPFIVGQNFNAPHETCFLPPLLLFSFYFYIKNRFKSFLFFLFLCLTVKEHMALMAIMYGLYALYQKKGKYWVIAPLILGLTWGAFSMWVIYFSQKIYHVDPYPAWLIDNIKRRFLRPNHPLWANIVWGFKTSIMGNWGNSLTIYLLVSPLLIILPFISSTWLLGLPEISINLLATIPLSYPTWHYNIVAGIFLLLSCVATIKKCSYYKTQELLSWFLCICILSHFFLWWDFTQIKMNPRYVNTMNKAISMVPMDASVSMTKHLVAYVSDRRDYFLCEDKRKGDYIVLDKDEKMSDCASPSQAAHYQLIFNQDGIRVYKASPTL